jgi:hypothetical protein
VNGTDLKCIASAKPRIKSASLVDLCSFGQEQTTRKHRTYFQSKQRTENLILSGTIAGILRGNSPW